MFCNVPSSAGRFSRLPVARPNDLLLFEQMLVLGPSVLELAFRNDARNDQKSLLVELLSVHLYLHLSPTPFGISPAHWTK